MVINIQVHDLRGLRLNINSIYPRPHGEIAQVVRAHDS